MLIVKPILDRALQEELCTECNITFDPEYLSFSAYDNDNFIGMCQFLVSGGIAIAKDFRLKPGINDFEAAFIMSRGALNYIDLCGFHIARCSSDAGDITLLRAIGFKKTEDNLYEMNLSEEFNGKCSNCK